MKMQMVGMILMSNNSIFQQLHKLVGCIIKAHVQTTDNEDRYGDRKVADDDDADGARRRGTRDQGNDDDDDNETNDQYADDKGNMTMTG